MKIVRNDKVQTKTFEDLDDGECFSYINSNNLYMKIKNISVRTSYNTVNINKGNICNTTDTCIIYPVKGAFVEE